MDKQQKIEFITELSDRIRDELIEHVNKGRILSEWDGHELRTLLLHAHRDSASMSAQCMKGKRMKCFKNHLTCCHQLPTP